MKTKYAVHNGRVYRIPPLYWRRFRAALRGWGAVETKPVRHNPADMLGLPKLREE